MVDHGLSDIERLKHISEALQVYKTVTDLLPEFKMLIDKMIEDGSNH